MSKKHTTTTKRERDPIYARARELIKLNESGVSNMEAVTDQLRTEFKISHERAEQAAARAARIKRHAIGTAPDTSLHLGDERRAWLKDRGGIQQNIQAMIDRAMKRNP